VLEEIDGLGGGEKKTSTRKGEGVKKHNESKRAAEKGRGVRERRKGERT